MNKLNKLSSAISPSNLFKIRDNILFILDKAGFNEIFRIINKNKYIILFYHGISNRNIKFSQRHFSKSDFERQIKYLKKKKYAFLNLTKLVNKQDTLKNPKHKYVILTFDDGFKDIINYAYPVMKKYKAKGCLYVISDIISKNNLLWTDYVEVLIRNAPNSNFKFIFNNEEHYYSLNSETEIQIASNDIKKKLRSISDIDRLTHLKQFKIPNKISSFKRVPEEYIIATWDDLKLLDKNTLEIGCHSKTHPNLTSLETIEEIQRELMESKLSIENKIGYKIFHFCYPAGEFNNNIIQYVKKYGYITATTTKEGFNTYNTELFQLRRIQVKNNFLVFKAKISGLYFVIRRIFKYLT